MIINSILTPSSFVLTGYGSDPRFPGGSYEGSKFPSFQFHTLLKFRSVTVFVEYFLSSWTSMLVSVSGARE